MSTALIIGVTSQDGSYLADFLLKKGYHVIGTLRRTTNYQHPNVMHLQDNITFEILDLTDSQSVIDVISRYQPDEIYNIAAQSVPADSWRQPYYTGDVTGMGLLRVLEAVRNTSPHSKLYQATSREIYGNLYGQANEETKIDANNPYGIAKAYAHMLVGCYRESYNLFACAGILFNHESPRRSLHFVTRKITAAVACIKNKVETPPISEIGTPLVVNGKLSLGWLDSQRDWGYAPEYVEAMWLMLQQDKPKDFVIGTNVSHTVRDVLEVAFGYAGLDWREHVVVNDKLLRPTEIKTLTGDYSLAKKILGWEPKTTFKELIEIMTEADLENFK